MILSKKDFWSARKPICVPDAGSIFWQRDLTDPRAGEMVAQMKKGDSLLTPTCDVVEAESIKGEDKEAVRAFIEGWLHRHIQTTLDPLFKLKQDDVAQGAPFEIAQKLHDALGIQRKFVLGRLLFICLN